MRPQNRIKRFGTAIAVLAIKAMMNVMGDTMGKNVNTQAGMTLCTCSIIMLS